SIPLFLGFTTARIPLGITMSFLITSPLINEIAVVLLWGLLGWKFTIIYVVVGMVAGIIGGVFMDAIRAERWLQPFLLEAMKNAPPQAMDIQPGQVPKIGLMERHTFAYSETSSIFRRVWLWVIVGVGLGALLHGFVPQEWFTENLGAGQWWSVPLAVAVGIPLYTNVTGIIPVMESLLLKGLPLGTTLAFCMSTVAASLPEVLMLKQVMSWKLLAVFLGMLLIIFTLVGWLFNLLHMQNF
ncbi:MAG TPA: permease, partial [Bilophila wadsworthia]